MGAVNPFRRDRRNRRVALAVEAEQRPADPLAASMAAIARGDQDAFAALYDELAATVHGVVLRVVRDPARSEEITQEVFVELWRLAPRFDGTRGTVKAWACTVAHRRAVDRVRSEQSARDRDRRDTALARTTTEPADEIVHDRLERERVGRALDRLTDLQRQAVELAYYGGHTYREVAVLLEVPEGTVKTRIRDGLIRLRDELGTDR